MDSGHPLAAGLQVATVSGRVLWGTEVSSRYPNGSAAAAAAISGTSFGLANGVVSIAHAYPPAGATRITQLVVCHKGTGTAGSGCLVNTQKTNLLGEQLGYSIGIGASGDFGSAGGYLAMLDNGVAWRTGTALADGPHVILHDVLPNTASTGHALYIDALTNKTSDTSANVTDCIYTVVSAQIASVGGNSRPLSAGNHAVAAFVWQGVAFTDAQKAQLLADPFCFLRR